jgi:Protein of unknown function (DUF3616)
MTLCLTDMGTAISSGGKRSEWRLRYPDERYRGIVHLVFLYFFRVFSMSPRYCIAAMISLTFALPVFAAPRCGPIAPIMLTDSKQATWSKKERRRRGELSGVVMRGGNLLAVSNERTRKRKHVVQVFEPIGANRFHFWEDQLLFRHAKSSLCKEADFEALAIYADRLYAVSSHSRKREKNGDISDCADRNQLVRFAISANGDMPKKAEIRRSLGFFFKTVKALQPFAAFPSKENGIDIEGLAVMPLGVLIGFRGPIFNNGQIPILRLGHDLSLRKKSTWFVRADFGGRGIRSMASSGNHLYFLAGPNAGQPPSFQIHRWVGKVWPGADASEPLLKTELLCELDAALAGKNVGNPEGITVLDHKRTDGAITSTRLVVVYDFDFSKFRAETWTLKE